MISLFVEQQVKSTHLHTFRVHVLPVIYPDRQLDERTASLRMQHTDYEQKCAAYVMAYGKKLTYDFEEGRYCRKIKAFDAEKELKCIYI